MKKISVLVAAMFAVVMSAKAEVEFAYEAGAELVSSYIWRGMYNGGLSLQPEGLVGFNALDEAIQFRGGVWANVGASDWKFKKGEIQLDDYNPNTYFVPEVDLSLPLRLMVPASDSTSIIIVMTAALISPKYGSGITSAISSAIKPVHISTGTLQLPAMTYSPRPIWLS